MKAKPADKREHEIVAEVEPATVDWVDQAVSQMSTPAAEREFNYEALPADHAKLASEAASAIKTSEKRMVNYALAIGQKLTAVKEVLEHGQFGDWLAAEFAFNARTAQNYMAAWAAFGDKSETVSHLPPATIYALAAPSTPEPVREDVVKRLEAGERFEPGAVNDMIWTAKQEAKKAAEEAKLTADERKRRDDAAKRKKKREERQNRDWEQERAEDDARRKRQKQAAFEAARLIERTMGESLPEITALIEDAEAYTLQRVFRLMGQGHGVEQAIQWVSDGRYMPIHTHAKATRGGADSADVVEGDHET